MMRFVLLSVAVGAAVGVARGVEPPVRAADARTKAARTVDIRFHVTDFTVKGVLTGLDPTVTPGRSRAELPSEDTTLEADDRLVFQDDMVRYENHLPRFHFNHQGVDRKPFLSVSNGEVSKFCFPDGMGPKPMPEGGIRRNVECEFIKTAYLQPFAMHFRGRDANVCDYPVQGLKPTGQRLPIRGVECTEYAHTFSTDSAILFWFGPAPDCLLMKVQSRQRGRVKYQCDIEYQNRPPLGVTPQSWSWDTINPDGRVTQSTRINVTGLTADQPLPPDAFDLSFPVGCFVTDQRLDKYYRVTESGAMREVSAAGTELPNPDVVSQPGGGWAARHFWLLVGCGVAVAVAGGWLAVQRVRRRAE